MYKKFGKAAPVGTIDTRGKGGVQSFGAPRDLKKKLDKYCTKKEIAKSQVIRDAIALYIGENKMAKNTTKEFDWKGLIVTLHELGADVPASKLATFIESKGVKISTRTIGATRANLSRG